MKIFGRFLVGVLLFLGFIVPAIQIDDVMAQPQVSEDILLDSNHSYGRNVDRTNKLYEDEKGLSIKKTTYKFPTPWIVERLMAFYIDIRNVNTLYFDILAFSSFIFFACFQCLLAKMLRHRNIWIGLSWLIAGTIWALSFYGIYSIIGSQVLIGLFILPGLWQLFKMAHVNFLKTLGFQIVFLLSVYGALITGYTNVIFFIYTLWTIVVGLVFFNVLSHLAFKCERSSWIVFNGFIPLIGIPLYMILCVKSLMDKRKVNPIFINVILSLLKKNMSKMAIRQKALSAKVQLDYFDHHYKYAIECFQKNQGAISKFFYVLNFGMIKTLLIGSIVIAFGQVTLGGLTFVDYYTVYQKNISERLFYSAIREDNVTALKKAFSNGVSVHQDCEGKMIEVCDPVYAAVYNDSVRVLPLLLDAGAVRNNTGENNWTPLIYAQQKKKDDQIITLLLNK